MDRLFKKIIVKVTLLIVLLDIILPCLGIKFGYIDEAKAFTTQLDSIAPGYVIKSEDGGVTFDLINRLSPSMNVESFNVKNTNKDKAKNDKAEELVKANGSKWITRDEMIHGDTYEITTVIYDSDLQDNRTFINTFKYIDERGRFNPGISISNLDKSTIINSYHPANAFIPQGIIIDCKGCRDIIDKTSNEIKVDLLNSDLTRMNLNTITTTKDEISRNGYKITIDYMASLFEDNKDYIMRFYIDNKIFDKMFSCSIKSKPQLYTTFLPNENPILYSNRLLSFNFKIINLMPKALNNFITKLSLSAKDKSLPTVEATEKLPPNSPKVLELTVPGAYIGTKDPSNLRYTIIDKGTGNIISDQTFQITFFQERTPHIWTGLEFEPSIHSDGYAIEYITPHDDPTYQVPHSWDGFPKAHYITLYDNTLTKQIGGEYRYDVINSKLEFLEKTHDVRGANFKIRFKDMKQGFNSYNFKVESSNSQYPDWKQAYIPFGFYADLLELKYLEVDVRKMESTKGSSNGYDFTLFINNQNVSIGDKMSIIDDNGKEYVATANQSKEFVFSNVPVISGGKYVVTFNKISGVIHFKSADSSILFNPAIVGTSVDGSGALEVTFDKKYKDILSQDNSKNRLKILYMNGNSTGNEFSNFGVGTSTFKITNALNNGESYIAEFTNSSGEVFKTTFEYTPLRIELGSVTGTTAKLNWIYPNNYLIMDGDVLNIYFKKEGFNYSSVPDAKIMHGFQGINFDDITTYTIKSLSPNMNYTAKLELITNDGVKYSSETEFVTSTFKILNESIEGMSEDGVVRDKNVNFMWDINQGDINFSDGDKIDVFVKSRSHDSFPRTPEKTITEYINRVKNVNVTLPNYYESYSIKIVYTIGGTRHSSKVVNFTVEPEPFDIKLSDVTDSTVMLNWEYPKSLEISDKQEIRIFSKKSSDLDYTLLKTLKQSEKPLVETKSYLLENLQNDTIYEVKMEYKVGDKVIAGVTEDITQITKIEVKTKRFVIDNFKVERIDSTRIRLKWKVSNEDYRYSDHDNIKVFLKEKSSSSYGDNAIFTSNRDLNNITSCEINIPKYEKQYDIKVVYTLKGKECIGYTTYSIKVGKISYNISSIDENKISVSWTYPRDYIFKNGDKMKLILTEEGSISRNQGNEIEKTHNDGENLGEFLNHEFTLTSNKKYSLRFIFKPVDLNEREEIYRFKSLNGFQILTIDAIPLNSTSIKLNWNFYTSKYNFKSGDKVEIFYKGISEESQDGSNDEENTDIFSGVSASITKTEGLNDFNSVTIDNLNVETTYLFRVKYTLSKDASPQTSPDDGSESRTSSNIIEVYEDIRCKPEYSKFSTYVIDTQATGVKIEIAYPENNEIVQNNIIDIFIKDESSLSYDLTPNFTAKHGSEEGEFDLNTVNILDIFGLSPNSSYKAKTVFWSGEGNAIKYEHELSFTTNTVNGISEILISDVIDHVVKVGIKMDPEDIVLSSSDSCKIYIKKSGEGEYPIEASGESRGDLFNDNKFIAAYFEELNASYDIKAVVDISGKQFEAETTFTNTIENLNIEIKEVNPMTAQIEWRYPSNYTLVDGESIQIFIKFKEDENFYEKPDLEITQSEEVNLRGINLVEIYSLIPETEYDVKVKLNLTEIELEPVTKSFKTESFEIKDLEIRSVNSGGVSVAWTLNTEEVDFIDDYDNLSIFVKNRDDDSYDYDKPVTEFVRGLNDIRSASFPIKDYSGDIDISVSYLIENYESYSEISYDPLTVNVEIKDNGVAVKWDYPRDIKFSDDDRLDVYLKKLSSSGYKNDPNFRYINGKDGDLSELNELFFKGLEPGEYVLKFSLITSDLLYSPIEIEFNTLDMSDSIPMIVKKQLNSRSIVVDVDRELDIDFEEGYSIYPEGLDIEISESGDLMINKIVPGKEYSKILVSFISTNGDDINLVATDVKTEPDTLLEEFLTNIYKFAFERYPDEGGYDYWLNKLLEKKDITGKFVLYNLMFAEREFSDRNLSDEELIKVLYQIVVNRESDEEGLRFWIGEYNNTYLPEANGDSYEAQKKIVTRMLYEPEFRNLCERMGILW